MSLRDVWAQGRHHSSALLECCMCSWGHYVMGQILYYNSTDCKLGFKYLLQFAVSLRSGWCGG